MIDQKRDNERENSRLHFIEKNGWAESQITALVPDASFRQYFRLTSSNLTQSNKTAMLMDAPPDLENPKDFILIANHLNALGVTAPKIFSHDLEQGFILLEDIGDDTFTRLIDAGENETCLYQKAITVLRDLHDCSKATDINLKLYDKEQFIQEAELFTSWYLPAVLEEKPDTQQTTSFIKAWDQIYSDLPDLTPTLVLRDYHVDNLMLVEDNCAVLDFQDALIGSPAYDVVSLLEDARRDISTTLSEQMLSHYLNKNPNLDTDAFKHHYNVWGAQRHCKVAGIFMRLWQRDNKPVYLQHLPRVISLLSKKLECEALSPLKEWFQKYQVDLAYPEHMKSS